MREHQSANLIIFIASIQALVSSTIAGKIARIVDLIVATERVTAVIGVTEAENIRYIPTRHSHPIGVTRGERVPILKVHSLDRTKGAISDVARVSAGASVPRPGNIAQAAIGVVVVPDLHASKLRWTRDAGQFVSHVIRVAQTVRT